MQTSKHHECVTSSDTGLRNANINTIYQITIVSHQDKKGVLVVRGEGRVVLERNEKSRINLKQPGEVEDV